MKLPTVEMLCLGNELLIGRTVNTNAAYIGLKMTKLGYTVKRITTVGDYFEDINDSLEEIRKRKPEVLFIMGGLGPTHDDIQLEALARHLSLPLQLNQQALDFIAEQLGSDKISETRKKMAMMPEGSIPLRNRAGVAPGVRTDVDGMIWFSLPGVPREMKSILDEEIIPILVSEFGKAELHEFGFNAFGIGESRISSITKTLVKKYPGCYFKSHPKKDDTYWLALHVYSSTESEEKVRKIAEEWKEAILAAFPEIKVTEPKPVFSDDFEPETSMLED